MSKLLIVEDNEKGRLLLEQSLRAKGYEVVSAEDGAVALDLIHQEPPDLVISDIMMPVKNGYSLCRELKKEDSFKHIPLIFYTATFVEKEDERLAMSLGAFRFLIKPDDDDKLESVINDALQQGRLQAQPEDIEEHQDLDNMLNLYDNSVARKLAEKVNELHYERTNLIKSELRLREAQEIAQVGHWEYDLNTGKFTCSDETCRVFGLKPGEKNFSQEMMLKMVHPEDRKLVENSCRALLEQMMTYDITYRILSADGGIRYVNERGQTICNDLGAPLSALGTIQNITAQKSIELELETYKNELEGIVEKRTLQLQKTQAELVKRERMALLGQLATTVSHELRNPLGTISNVLDLLEHEIKNGDTGKLVDKLNLANRNIDRCDRIIGELLEFANTKPPKTSNINFDDQLKLILNDLSWDEDVECELSLGVNSEVQLDPTLVHRIINNIVNNSLQALAVVQHQNKKIKIESSLQDQILTVSIQDNGPGIAEADQEKIFEPLYSTKPFGVGLGMAIVKNAVDSLDGKITVDSIEGRGTTTVISFPV